MDPTPRRTSLRASHPSSSLEALRPSPLRDWSPTPVGLRYRASHPSSAKRLGLSAKLLAGTRPT
ncbi:Hypothetical protein FKW44_023927 [Caligus rogercresseyi]|uniref:Uncharacterized protein n=1 Tax=Caligus rogercresseyi TaxID=217165 RepID=A0A7T8GQ22_CALRO|nr:Hypothetical protein FKW44_023927 [Caligus rogercresseyi]